MRRKLSKIVSPLHSFRKNLKRSTRTVKPRNATPGQPDVDHAADVGRSAPQATQAVGRATPSVNDGHFVQTKRKVRQMPDNLHREPTDDETLRAIAERLIRQAADEGDDIAEVTPWELKVAARYAAKFEKTAEEALWIVLTNREDIHYIAGEVGMEPPSSPETPSSAQAAG